MAETTLSSAAPETQGSQWNLDTLEHSLRKSTLFAWFLIAGLPALGLLASLLVALPLFATLMAMSFLLATSLVCRTAICTFTGKTLRLLVAGRLVLVLVLAAVLFCTSGNAWAGMVSALLLWLTTDRLLGRRALYDLWKLVRG